MAAIKKTKAGPSKSPKTPVKKAPQKAAAKPTPKKGAAKAAKPLKAAPRMIAKTVPSRAPAAKPKISKKPTLPAKPAKKALPAAAAPKKDLIKKTVSTVSLPSAKSAQKPAAKPVAAAAEPKKLRPSKSDLQQFKVELLAMRDRITGQSGSMRNAALQRNDETNHEEDGTDAFLRLQTLEQVSSQQQIIANIDEALRSIEKGTYGICDMCGDLINKPRLAVLPFAKNCIKCQSEMERSNRFVGRR